MSGHITKRRLNAVLWKKTGNAFEDFFSAIMALGYPADFMRCRPWGNKGDRKNDGYLRSKRMLFQVYAPNQMTEHECISKMEADFRGALSHWRAYFDTWVFVHNSLTDLGPAQNEKLLELNTVEPDLTVTSWGFEAIRREFFQLSEMDMISLLGVGSAPAQYDMQTVRFEHLQHVLTAIAIQSPSLEPDLRAVPEDKLQANKLSDEIVTLLNEGIKKSFLVDQYFRLYSDPTLGEGLAQTFNQYYGELRQSGMTPDQIFHKLHVFAGGTQQNSEALEAAVLAVLAYFFEKCDIFERTEEVA